MADFEEALNSLLADPDAMGQIMSLAGKLGMGTESPPSPGEAAPQPESAAPPPFAPEQLGQMGRLLEALWRMAAEGQTANETAALLGAAEEWLNRME